MISDLCVHGSPRGDNEQKSAAYAARALSRLNVAAAKIERIQALILSTKTHQARDRERCILLDADLAILGAPPEVYGRYARAIRREYAGVCDRDYAAGRVRVLSRFLTRSRIYQNFRLIRTLRTTN